MDNRPIGVFDSGLGGLTAVLEIKKIMPNEDIVYFGDTGRVPYGTRSEDTITSYSRQDINFLKTHNIKAIVVACGTASSVAVPRLCDDFKTPIFDVLKPTVLKAMYGTPKKIGIIGTNSTIKSGSYQKLIQEIAKERGVLVQTFAKACPLFVPLVENGRISTDDEVTNLVVKEYLLELKEQEIDTLIMGCTHYPLISANISNFLGENVRLIDPGAEVAHYLKENIDECEKKVAKHEYFVTDDPESFSKNAKIFLGEEIFEKTKLIDITKF